MERITRKHIENALHFLNKEAGYDPETAGRFDRAAGVTRAGFALDSQNLRAAGDRHNRYQLEHYDGRGTGCGHIAGTYSFTMREIHEKITAMREALRLSKAGR